MYFNVDVGCSASYLTWNKYFIVQIAENTFILHCKRSQNRTTRLPISRWNWNKKIAACFSKPTPIFSDVEMKVVGNSIVRFFKMCLRNWWKINKSGELTRLLTFGCLVSSLREIFPTDAGQLSDRLKFLAGQNKILWDRSLSVINLLSLFARNHRTFVRKTEIFCKTEWKFTSFVRQSCSFCEDCS